MSARHRLNKPRRVYAPKNRELQQFGALGGTVTLTMAGLACLGCIWGVPVIARSAPPDLFASPAPTSPFTQRPFPGLLPGSGASLRTVVTDGVFGQRLNAGVASDLEVLHAALSEPLKLSVSGPIGHWVGLRWVSADPIVHPTTPCPSPMLDPAGWRRWWQLWFPHLTPPVPPAGPAAPPVAAPVTAPVAPPVVAPVAEPAPAPVEPTPAPAATPEPQPAPVVDVTPVVVVDPPQVDPPAVDAPPVSVDLPVVDPVVIDPPSVDLPPVDPPPVSVPPVDTTPITDPVADALPEPAEDAVDDVASVVAAPAPEPDTAVSLNAPADDARKDATTDAGEDPVPLSATAPSAITSTSTAPHSTSGNGESYVGKHRAEVRDSASHRGLFQRGSSGGHRDSAGVHGAGRKNDGDHHSERRVDRSDRVSGGKHRKSDSHVDRKSSHSKHESHSGGKSHSGGGKSHGGSRGGHGGGRHG